MSTATGRSRTCRSARASSLFLDRVWPIANAYASTLPAPPSPLTTTSLPRHPPLPHKMELPFIRNRRRAADVAEEELGEEKIQIRPTSLRHVEGCIISRPCEVLLFRLVVPVSEENISHVLCALDLWVRQANQPS